MIFDHRAELPTATLLPRESSARFSVGVRNWIAARWGWLRPRTVPVLVAFVGMMAVLASASYLRNIATEPPERLAVKPMELHVASNEPTTTATHPSLVVTTGPVGAVITTTGTTAHHKGSAPMCRYPIRLEPSTK